VHNDFPTPTIPPPDWLRPRNPDPPDQSVEDSANPHSPTQPRNPPRPLPPVPPFDSSTSISNIPDSVPPSQISITESIPDLLIQQLTSISQTLRTAFADKPPHTIQRLAELVLNPNKHYKTLPAWLRAVDRAVSVTSTADIFPLPQAQSLPQGVLDVALTNGMTNGLGSGIGGGGILWTNSDTRDAGLGSDESLGGALLTPIPWLKNGEIAGTTSPRSDPLEPVDPPSNAFVPERQDGAVTQGELIRMEQEAGIVPVGQTVSEADVEVEGEGAESAPHARGPDKVGVEDMGLQDGKDIELQISKASPKPEPAGMEEIRPGVEPGLDDAVEPTEKQEAMPANGDGDIVLTDVDGKTEESEPQADTSGENVGPGSVDTSAR
jgi:PPP4R2